MATGAPTPSHGAIPPLSPTAASVVHRCARFVPISNHLDICVALAR
jgi:hypothetical protein